MATETNEYRLDTETIADLKSTVEETDLNRALGIFEALADERRVTVLRLLGETELCVCDLVEIFDIDYSNLSYHLKKMKEADLVTADRDGNYVTYRATDRGETVIEILQTLS
ncbi:ArsR/SmtB family transcription factor [Halodesulfurarchaeum sp.]|uniref:ArsR/SmtB family transcription factor n=1 Tax=Halodesulfurarchaeum sp. TaxID=1980530 RepID=UPI001BBCE951|nr:winged helix-turn-helix transcriptional regulator [Halodesulfurarchaeum sp.]